MTISEYTEKFLGLPVEDYDPEKGVESFPGGGRRPVG